MIKTSQVLFWFGLSLCAVTALYHTSDRARDLNRQLRQINAAIEAEQQNMHVLKAEWVFLSNPTRVESQTKKHLTNMRPTVPVQVIQVAGLEETLPTNAEASQDVAVSSTPIPNIKTSMAIPPAPKKSAAAPKKIAVAANDGHINDRMIIQRTASAQTTDSIGALIDGLGTR